MTLRKGDRVRVQCVDSTGAPSYQYGYLEAIEPGRTGAIVIVDDVLEPWLVPLDHVAAVAITTVELCMDSNDLFRNIGHDAALRLDLLNHWLAEAEAAGLDLEGVVPLDDNVHAGLGTWPLAEVRSGGNRFLLRIEFGVVAPGVVRVHAVPHYSQN